MAKPLQDWVNTDVARLKDKPLKWLAEEHFFRDPSRPTHADADYFFSPADGIILYQKMVKPDECIVDIKGKAYSLRDAMRDETFDRESLVIGIFMTMYDVHINRVPYSGLLSYKQMEPIRTLNMPMLDMEKSLIEQITVNTSKAGYLHNNQRVINRVYAADLRQWYYVLQVADYDVDCITPFNLGQNAPVAQNERFSMIRFGSQCDLIVSVSKRFDFEMVQDTGMHVEAGLDPLIKIIRKN